MEAEARPAPAALTPYRLGLRIAPMFVIPWLRSTLGVVLPGLIATFGLSLREAGLVTVAIEAGSVTTMLILGLIIDRLGAGRVIVWGLPVMGSALALATLVPSFEGLFSALVLLGVGVALTASGVNAVIADTGPRRAEYLGILHAGFSIFSVVTPLAAGLMLVWADWQWFYRLIAGLAFMVLAVYLAFERPGKPGPTGQVRPPSGGLAPALWRIAGVCVGVSALTGVQGILITWSYLYMVNRYGAGHAVATLAPSSVWFGILAGRAGMIWLSRRRTARAILLYGIALTGVAVSFESLLPSTTTAFTAFVLAGVGVSGAYQLGTAWTADRLPERIGTASTFVMASGAIGLGVWPWIAAAVVEATSFASMAGVMLAGLLMAAALFALTRPAKR
jgi:MFS family permease